MAYIPRAAKLLSYSIIRMTKSSDSTLNFLYKVPLITRV